MGTGQFSDRSTRHRSSVLTALVERTPTIVPTAYGGRHRQWHGRRLIVVVDIDMNDQQIAFVALYFIYVGVVLAFHATILLYPFRLLTTFLHEISHAIACWLTCGSVRAIKVYDNEGGVTSYVGGCRILIIPAGYVGSAVWGCAFVSFSGGRKTSTGAAGVLIGVLLYALCFAPNKT